MKKSRLFASTLSLALAGALCFGVTACSDPKDPHAPMTPEDVKEMTGEEVTAEKWTAAFAASNFTNVKVDMTNTVTGKFEKEDGTKVDAKQINYMTYIVAGNLEYSKEYYEAEGPDELLELIEEYGVREEYSSETDGKVTYYYKEDGNWKSEESSHGVAYYMLRSLNTYAEAFESFEYNTEQKGYVVKADSDLAENMPEGTVMVLKFKDGKLAVSYSERTEGEGDDAFTTVSAAVVTYGGQSLTLPQVQAPSNPYVGTWKLYQITIEGTTYGLGDTIPAETLGEGAVPVVADLMVITANQNGTASYSFFGDTGTGTWVEATDGILFTPDETGAEEISVAYDGTYLSMDVNGFTFVLAKA